MKTSARNEVYWLFLDDRMWGTVKHKANGIRQTFLSDWTVIQPQSDASDTMFLQFNKFSIITVWIA